MTEENKQLAHRYYEAGARDDLDAWDEICSPDMVLYPGFMEPVRGLATVKQFTAGFHQSMSGLYITVHDVIAEGDRVAVRWTEGGTNTGPMQTPRGVIPPTGKPVEMAGMSMLRVTGGKITEERVHADFLGFMQQLGAVSREP